MRVDPFLLTHEIVEKALLDELRLHYLHAHQIAQRAGHTVFIDRHLPKSFRWLTRTVRVDPFLLTHEIVEKALLDELRLHYLHAHQALRRRLSASISLTGAHDYSRHAGDEITNPLARAAQAQRAPPAGPAKICSPFKKGAYPEYAAPY